MIIANRGTVVFDKDSIYNGRRIGDMTHEERQAIRQRWMDEKGAGRVIFKGCEDEEGTD